MSKLKIMMKALFCAFSMMLIVVLFNSCDKKMKYFDESELEKAEKPILVNTFNQYELALVGDDLNGYNDIIFRDENYEYKGHWKWYPECMVVFFISNPPSIKFPDGMHTKEMLYIEDGYLYYDIDDLKKEKRRARVKMKFLYMNQIGIDKILEADKRKRYK